MDVDLRRMVVAAVVCWCALILICYVFMLPPPTKLDQKCLNSSLADMHLCIADYYREQNTK